MVDKEKIEGNIAEQVSYMIQSRGWYVFRRWLEEQIDFLTQKLISSDTTDICDVIEMRTKIRTYKQILAKPSEMAAMSVGVNNSGNNEDKQ